MNDNFAIRVENLDHIFLSDTGKKNEVLKNIAFGVKPGEFFTILGPSGCGKSTLLRVLAGIIHPTRGKVIFASSHKGDDLSMIFQSFALFPWLSVHENVEFGLRMRSIPKEKREVIVKEHIQEIGLKGFEMAYSKDLSGGMKQRVGIARALATNPQILLMDEPFSSLDSFTAERLRDDLLNVWLKDKITIVMVTHLVDEAVEMSDRVLVMTPRPGMVEELIEVKLPRPRNKRSEEFFALVDRIKEVVKL